MEKFDVDFLTLESLEITEMVVFSGKNIWVLGRPSHSVQNER